MAWLGGGSAQSWAADVFLETGPDGAWLDIHGGVSRQDAQRRGCELLDGPLLPGVINAHSHAFQRAFAGLAERRETAHDDFWSWRDRMYRVALAISPEQLKAVAAQLYVELLHGGYTHVCEFHYLHHSIDGAPYSDPLTMAWILIDAAREVGIGITLLPVLYERSGFGATSLRVDQRRFATDAQWVLQAQQRIGQHAGSNTVNAGVAIHSLRAASAAAIRTLVDAAQGPIHVHVAEQTGEVEECLKVNGLRPVQWLAQHHCLDSRWQLVHATHVTPAEIGSVADSGACAVICPTTEANLGDGTTDLAAWLDAGTTLAIGSDSHVTRDWREELRLLEYGQRLQLRARNIAASPSSGHGATAEHLFARVVTGGAAAAGQARWGLVVGARADALLVDSRQSALLGVPRSRTLDALIFSSPSRPFTDVMVAGRWVTGRGRQGPQVDTSDAFTDAMQALWSDKV
jgi:formimidoylglutamate deiminase